VTDSYTSAVSPITAVPLPDKIPLAGARAAGRFGHDKPTVDNSIVLLIDHQVGLLASTRIPPAPRTERATLPASPG